MSDIKKNIIICFLLVFMVSTYLQSKDFDLLNTSRINQGARLASLGTSFIADYSDPGIMYFNPAGLSYLKNVDIQLTHYQENSINGFSHGVIFPIYLNKFEGIAFSLNSLHSGYFKKNDLPQLRFLQVAYNVAYSREIFTNMSVGAIFGFQYTKSKYNDLWTYRSLISVSYVPTEEISYSFTVGEFGDGMKYSLSDTETILRRIRLPNGIQLGITMQHPINMKETLFSISLATEKVFNEAGARYKTGIEIYPTKFISLRTGYVVTNGLKYATFGGGIILGKFKIDGAIYPNRLTNNEIYLTLSYKLVN